MRFPVNDAIAILLEGYKASLEDDAGFVAAEMNDQCGADIFVSDDDNDTLIFNQSVVDEQPHVRFEYDTTYWGGEYSKTGQFAYIPQALITLLEPEEAFFVMTGYAGTHIVHYSLDDLYNAGGDEWDDSMEVRKTPI